MKGMIASSCLVLLGIVGYVSWGRAPQASVAQTEPAGKGIVRSLEGGTWPTYHGNYSLDGVAGVTAPSGRFHRSTASAKRRRFDTDVLLNTNSSKDPNVSNAFAKSELATRRPIWRG